MVWRARIWFRFSSERERYVLICSIISCPGETVRTSQKKKKKKKGGQWHCWLEHGGVALFWTVDQGLVHVFVLHFIWCLYRNPVFSPYSCSYLRWSKLLGMLERCMYLYWYYFVLVLWYDPCLLLQLPSGWFKLLGTLERCMYLHWYYFVLVLWYDSCLVLQLTSDWTKLLGTLERCMYLYWYYFGLVWISPLSCIAATFRLNQTSWNTWKVHVFVLLCCVESHTWPFPF